MPFTKENKPLLEEAASIDFQFMKNGAIAYRKHTKHELGLYFIKLAIEKHGNTYGYQEVDYVTSMTKVTIVCSKHGRFEQSPNNHLKGQGCPLCGKNAVQTTDTFIKRALDIHGNKYDYSETQYSGKRNKVTVICGKHGRYSILAGNHLSGIGCSKCSGKYSPTTEEFIEKARNVHGNKYDYSETQYSGVHNKVTVICEKHGRYSIRASHHLSGIGCAQCSYDSLKMSLEEFLVKAKKVHGSKYDYSRVTYRNAKEKIEIVCPLHGSFFQTPTSHLNFRGCPKCAGKNHNILYLLKCLVTGWYKIGITTDNIQKRLLSIGGELEEIHHVVLEDPRKHESILHNLYNAFNVYHDGVHNGNTEFFSLTEEQVRDVIDYMNEVSNER